jgi:polysaccharide export outer membrane protein
VRFHARLTGALLCFIALCLITLNGCSPKARPQPRQDNRARAALDRLNRRLVAEAAETRGIREYAVGPEDLIEVSLFDLEDQDGEARQILVRVSQAGRISLPLIGHVDVGGRSALEIEDILRQRYKKFIHEPQITVFIKEYRSYRVSVVGYVEQPGLYEISGDKTLLEALGMAGGLNDAAGTTVRLTRRTDTGLRTYYIDLDQVLLQGDMSLNVPLLAGDVVNVPKAGIFYVEGSVKNPGSYPIRGRLTVTQAIATAGGADQRLAKESATTLFRRGRNGERQAIPIDLDGIRSGRVPDLKIAENDVILVPMSTAKFVTQMFVSRIGIGYTINGR